MKLASNFDPDSAIQSVNLTKQYGNVAVVSNISLQIPRGSIFGFLGPNGAGKSTTVRMLAGILRPTTGTAMINGLSVELNPIPVKRQVGVVSDDLALFEALTIWEHLMLSGAAHGLPDTITKKRSAELLDLLSLDKDSHKLISHISFGTRKKTALAMALLHGPSVLFLDEPFEGLDPIIVRSVKDILRQLASRGVTVFLTSHMLDTLDGVIDSCGVIKDGCLSYSCTVQQLRAEGISLEEAYLRQFPPHRITELAWM
ncbi:MAG TPA: ABC transporter ATP-binding protein [Candidatus Angelobacter sp.]|nr:ABC transporter ATP-binding protein [Candidatus Angelobacter sp.]